MGFKLSRNAPCPCNSGLKYKKCCMGKLAESHEKYYGLPHKQGIIKEKLVRWVSQNFDPNELDRYVYEFNQKNFDELKSDEDMTNFFDWFLLEAVHKQERKKILKLIIDDFSYLFNQDELKILGEWRDNTQSGIFEIEKIEKENWKVFLREIFSNKKYEITDRRASSIVIKGDIIFGRVQEIFSNYYLSGAVTNYPRFQSLSQLKDFVSDKFNIEKNSNPNITYEGFMNSNSKVLNNFEIKMPEFITPEGEEAKLCEAAYDVDLKYIEDILDWFDENDYFLITDEDYRGNKFKSVVIACLKQNDSKMIDDDRNGYTFMSHYIDEYGNKIETEGGIEIKANELKVFSQSENVFRKIIGN